MASKKKTVDVDNVILYTDSDESVAVDLTDSDGLTVVGSVESETKESTGKKRKPLGTMMNRIIIGLIVAGVIVSCLCLRQFQPVIVDVLAVLIMSMTGVEMCYALGKKYDSPILGFIIAYPFCALGAYYGGIYASVHLKLFNGLIMLLLFDIVYFFLIFITVKIKKEYNDKNFFSTVFCLIYPMTLVAFMFALNRLGSPVAIHKDFEIGTFFGVTPIALMFVVSSFSDILAMVFGMTFKGPKLCPKISPKKTVSGAIGGLLGGILGAGLILGMSVLPVFSEPLGLGALPYIKENAGFFCLHMILIGLLGSVATQCGDLIASVIKRDVGIKDYGTALGKHGGFMDRVDGQILNAFGIYIYLMITVVCCGLT